MISKLDLHAEAARHDRMCDMAYPADRFVTPEAAENGQYETAIHRRLERKHCPKFKILVIALDRPKEKVLRRLGNVHDLVSAWMRRTAMGIPRENPDFILDIRTFESLALDCTYPSVEQLEAADLVILVSSGAHCQSPPYESATAYALAGIAFPHMQIWENSLQSQATQTSQIGFKS